MEQSAENLPQQKPELEQDQIRSNLDDPSIQSLEDIQIQEPEDENENEHEKNEEDKEEFLPECEDDEEEDEYEESEDNEDYSSVSRNSLKSSQSGRPTMKAYKKKISSSTLEDIQSVLGFDPRRRSDRKRQNARQTAKN